MSTHNELPMLAGIGAFIHWCEELASLLAGPVLTAGLGIALIDLLTDGKLLATTPMLLFAWAASQTVGLDAQLVGSAAKLGVALRKRAWPPVFGYALLVLALGYVAFQASNVFATQQADGLTTAQALAHLGMDSATWIVERSALAVMLVVLSGLLRYAAPASGHASLDEERASLEQELALEPLRQRLRAQQIGGIRALAETALRGSSATATASELRKNGVVYARPQGVETPASPPIRNENVSPDAAYKGAVASDELGAPLTVVPWFEASYHLPEATHDNDLASFPRTRRASREATTTDDRNTRPATGSAGSLSPASKPRNITKLRPGYGRSPRADRRTAARINSRGGRRGKAEQRIREALASNPTLTDEQLMHVADVSSSTVSKWRRVIDAEQREAH